MPHFHRLDADADRDFLASGAADPLTATPFRATNTVVLTSSGTVLLRETWEALGGRYGGSAETLPWGTHVGDGAAGSEPEAPPPEASGAAASGAAASGAAASGAVPPQAVAGAAGTAAGLGAAVAGATAATAPTVTAPPSVPPAPRSYVPPRAAEPEPARKRAWLLPLAGVLAVAGIVVAGLFIGGVIGGDRAPAPPPVETPAAPPPPAPAALEAGLFEGELGEGDREGAGGRYEDRFTFDADSSGRTLLFALSSEAFRPDLVVVGPDGQRYEAAASGDDGARVAIEDLRGAGRYELRVTSREPAGTGAYALRIREETPITALRADGQTVRATLGQTSVRVDGFFRDTYEFAAEADREYTLRAASSAFDLATTLTTAGGGRVTADRGSGGALTFTPSQDGRYRLVVTSRERGQRGAYTLSLRAGPRPVVEAPPPPRVRALQPNAAAARDSVAAGAPVTYTFQGRVGDRVRVDARALGFSPSVALVGPDGRRVSGQTTNERASVSETLATAGTYRVVVSAGETGGPFQLSLERTEAPRAADIPRLPGQDLEPPREQEDDGGDDGGR